MPHKLNTSQITFSSPQNQKRNEMKFICAGYPKTGSKSCSSALRKLGYKVADILETFVSIEKARS